MAFWRVHGGSCTKTVSWVTQAIGGRPELPLTDTGSANEVIMLTIVSPQIPQMNQDGLLIWTITGKYIYDLQTPPSAGDQLGTGRHPLSILPPELNTLRVTDFFPMLGAAVVTNFIGGQPINF